MITATKEVNEITLSNIKNGEVSLIQLNEIYEKMGFVFVVNQGRLIRVKKEIKH